LGFKSPQARALIQKNWLIVNTYILPCATALHPLTGHVEFHTQILSLLSVNDEDFIPNNFIYNNK